MFRFIFRMIKGILRFIWELVVAAIFFCIGFFRGLLKDNKW